LVPQGARMGKVERQGDGQRGDADLQANVDGIVARGDGGWKNRMANEGGK